MVDTSSPVPLWLKVTYPVSKKIFVVGTVMPSTKGDWVLFCQVPPRDMAKPGTSPKLFDLSVIDCLTEKLPHVGRVLVHFKGSGQVYILYVSDLADMREDLTYRRTASTDGDNRSFLAIPARLWSTIRVKEPYPAPKVPYANCLVVRDGGKEKGATSTRAEPVSRRYEGFEESWSGNARTKTVEPEPSDGPTKLPSTTKTRRYARVDEQDTMDIP